MKKRRARSKRVQLAARTRTKADTTAYSEPSARSAAIEWSPEIIRAAELVADTGNLRLASELCDAMLADDQVQGALTTLVGALAGLPLTFEASGDKRRSRSAIKALEAGEDWWKALPEPELNLLLTWGVLLGIAVGEIVWTEDPDTGRVPGLLRVWHPRHLRWDGPARRWMLRVDDAGHEIEITPNDGRWILFAPKGARRPWKQGAWRAIARWWLLKDYALRDWGAYSERHGTGTLVAESEPTALSTSEKRKQLASELNGLGRNTSIAMPPGWRLRLVEAVANTSQTFEKQIALADRGITIALHGTNLTNEEGGSYAKATVLNGVHVQVLSSLAEGLSTTLHDGHLVYWAEYNFGDRRLAPWPLWDASPPEDKKGKADALGSVATACTTLKALSPRVDVDAILEEYGVPLLKEAPPPTSGADAPNVQPQQRVFAREALPSYVEGQLYADTVADDGRDRATATFRPDLRALLDVIERADDYETLRAALRETYRGMNPRALADVTRKALLLGELGGRLSANP